MMSESNKLVSLRTLMKNAAINAYIIPTDDAHQSEYPAKCDRRREFVSGFTGSAGTAIVTTDAAALWTDGRNYLQAGEQLDGNQWTLMKEALPTTPKQEEWLCKILPPGGKVGSDPWLISAANWVELDKALSADGFSLVAIADNLVDKAWETRPSIPDDKIVIQPMKFAGETWQSKVKRVQEKLSEKNASCMVITALDEIAWLFNLRGADVPCVPVFFSYALVCTDSVHLFVDSSKFSPEVFSHLGLSIENGSTGTPCDDLHVNLHGYGDVSEVLQSIAQQSTQKVWITSQSSQALHTCIPEDKRLIDFLPTPQMKAVKNEVEIAGMKNAHIKDAAALCEYFSWLEQEVPKGHVTEMSGAAKVEGFRSQHDDFVGISFDTISSVGFNGAIIHYIWWWDVHICIYFDKRLIDFLPTPQMKAVKNEVEIAGMKNAHIKDAAALCEYFSWLEQEVPKGHVTEMSGAAKVEGFRSQHDNFVGISFDTISSVGSNGAIIHYMPTPETDKSLNMDEIYLCDSGAQFKDGTTDVTRTMHFGTPTQYEKECFTRVLKGHIQLESTIFPPNIKGLMLDTLARTALWQVGLNYRHGTGHGVGAYLHVHEGPVSISWRTRPGETNLETNVIMSNEPGFYEDGKFGVRIESLVVIVPKATKYTETGYMTFEPITFVPIQSKLIDSSLLTAAEIDWVNQYHQQCLDKVRPLLEKLGKTQAVEWLVRETQPIS